jgi:hypothetical protein
MDCFAFFGAAASEDSALDPDLACFNIVEGGGAFLVFFAVCAATRCAAASVFAATDACEQGSVLPSMEPKMWVSQTVFSPLMEPAASHADNILSTEQPQLQI